MKEKVTDDKSLRLQEEKFVCESNYIMVRIRCNYFIVTAWFDAATSIVYYYVHFFFSPLQMKKKKVKKLSDCPPLFKLRKKREKY